MLGTYSCLKFVELAFAVTRLPVKCLRRQPFKIILQLHVTRNRT